MYRSLPRLLQPGCCAAKTKSVDPEMQYLLEALIRGPVVIIRVCGSVTQQEEVAKRVTGLAKANDIKLVQGPLCELVITEVDGLLGGIWTTEDAGTALH